MRIGIQRRKIVSYTSCRNCLPPSKLYKLTARRKITRKLRPARLQIKEALTQTLPQKASNGEAPKKLVRFMAGRRQQGSRVHSNGTIEKQCNSMMFKSFVCSYLMLSSSHLNRVAHTVS